GPPRRHAAAAARPVAADGPGWICRDLAAVDAGHAARRHPAGRRHSDRSRGLRGDLWPHARYAALSRNGFCRFYAHGARYRGAYRRAFIHLRWGFGIFLDIDHRLPAAATGRAPTRARRQHGNLYGRLDRTPHPCWRAARRAPVAQRRRAADDTDCREARLERNALRTGADHRYGHWRFHAARGRGLLCLLCYHAL